jgi:hypothetical protein
VKGEDGNLTAWNIEDASPSSLVRDGWSSKALKPGDDLQMEVEAPRSGAPGGDASRTKFKDGQTDYRSLSLGTSIRVCARL